MLGGLVTAAPGTPTAAQILDFYAARYGRVEYSAIEQLQERQADGQLVTVTNELKFRPGRERSRFVGGPTAYKGVIQADNGQSLTIYLPIERRAYVYDSQTATQQQRRRAEVARLGERFEVTLVGTENIAHRSAYHLRLSPRAAGGPRGEVWLDSEQYVPLRQELFTQEQLWRGSVFTSVNFAPNLKDADFSFSPPDGTTVVPVPRKDDSSSPRAKPFRANSPQDVRRYCNIRVMQPKWVPEGFRWEGYYLAPPQPAGIFHRRVQVKFVKGTSILVLNQGVTAPPRRGSNRPPDEPTEVKPGVFFWTKNNVRLLLIGPRDCRRADLRQCAESVNWYDAR